MRVVTVGLVAVPVVLGGLGFAAASVISGGWSSPDRESSLSASGPALAGSGDESSAADTSVQGKRPYLTVNTGSAPDAPVLPGAVVPMLAPHLVTPDSPVPLLGAPANAVAPQQARPAGAARTVAVPPVVLPAGPAVVPPAAVPVPTAAPGAVTGPPSPAPALAAPSRPSYPGTNRPDTAPTQVAGGVTATADERTNRAPDPAVGRTPSGPPAHAATTGRPDHAGTTGRPDHAGTSGRPDHAASPR